MPKGKHKGGRRHFTDFEASEEEKLKKEKERQWRKNRGESDSEDSDEESKGSSEEESEESESSEEEDAAKQPKAKGVSGLIQTQNLNRQVQKSKKVSEIDLGDAGKAQLSRKEKEEVERQKATAHYRKLHAAGKTDEARADLERLAIVRKQREDAAKRKEEEKKGRDAAANQKKDQVSKALNKKKDDL